ncbi:hypothetical protein GYMLUDRAFT_41287 [Collybiopsis luxurians FD-317 M1]|uniref:Uncharacterized protein n=1 Tax=Collybiopsis luxurians FD-317 M1 TaxID=944289 RepID=A0A0D0C4D0_9AGAR|nr:hypothetical protein GYMLUDRAFT_41287 [Collybiopsis luxurians FD-317 M1]
MFATLVSVALFAAAAISGAAAQQLSISTPQFTTCQPAEITWSATQGPYNLIMTAPDDPCTAVVDLGDQDGTSVSWTPNVPAGTQLELSLIDSTGEEAWSGTITVAQGSDTSCVNADAVASASSSASSGSSESSVSVTGTTLVVTGSATTQTASASSSTNAGPLGAVGNNGPLEASGNGAMTHASAPIMILSAVAGILAFSL